MTPQTLQGAALSDADIDAVTDAQWGKGCAPNQYMAHRAAARAYIDADRRLTAEQPVAWEGAEEWEPLAWELCANECGEDACNELIWEGGAVPEPWGERWLKYEGAAKEMIAQVRKYARAPVTAEQGGALAALLQELREATDLEGFGCACEPNVQCGACKARSVMFKLVTPLVNKYAALTQPQAEPSAHLSCGHPASLMLASAETGEPLYCELCDDKSGRRDAEQREAELSAELAEANETIRQLNRALGEEVNGATFMGEPAPTAQPQAEPADARIYWHASQGWQVEWLTAAPNGGASNYYRATTAPTEATA